MSDKNTIIWLGMGFDVVDFFNFMHAIWEIMQKKEAWYSKPDFSYDRIKELREKMYR